MNALEIRDLTKHYTGFSLNHLNLTLPWGCIMGLVGENGAGKSTTIKLILNTISRDGGTVTILGRDNRENLCLSKEEIGVVLDEAYFPEVLTAENVASIMRDTYRNWDDAYYRAFLKRFALPDKKPFRDFSRGMKMKLALGVALSHKPKLLLLDEATSGLDPMVRDEMLDLFNDFTLEEDHSILLSSHIVSDLEKICDYIAFLHKGRLVLCEEKDRLLEEYALMKLSRADFEAVPPEALVASRTTAYGVDALIRTPLVSAALPRERTTLEDIILFLARGEDQK